MGVSTPRFRADNLPQRRRIIRASFSIRGN